MSWLSTALWVLPAAAAVLVGLAPAKLWGRSAFAIAAMLANLVLALIAIGQFDSSKGLQFAESREWVSDLGLTYHVGIDGLSLVMVALTAFCVPLATAFGLWAKRENLRVEAVVETEGPRAGQSYGVRLRLGEGLRPAPPAPAVELGFPEVAQNRGSLAWCSGLADRVRALAREFSAAGSGPLRSA